MRMMIKRDKSFSAKYLICSDLQIPFHFEAAVKNLKKLVNTVKFDLVLNVGDELDLNTLSKYAQGKAESFEQTLNYDRDLCRNILFDLKTDVVSRSNHTDRLYKAVTTVPGLVELPELQYEKFMGFKELGIHFAKKPYEIPGSNFVLAHGDEGVMSKIGGQTALNLAKRWGRSVICGHSHRMGYGCHSEAFQGRLERVLVGVEVGHTCNISKMSYLAKGAFYANWQAGAVIMTIKKGLISFEMIRFENDGSFTAQGRSFG